MGVAVNSRTILLSWEPPPADQHNGVLRHYIIRVIEMETGQVRRYNSTTTSLQVPLLHPYYTYEWNVSAYTVGEGPHTNLSSVRTPQDSEFCLHTHVHCSYKEHGFSYFIQYSYVAMYRNIRK